MSLVRLAEPPFKTWQGEYPLLGLPVLIVRFAGCNLKERCLLNCDTKYSWLEGKEMETNTILDLTDSGLMITGGEPFLQKEALFDLIRSCCNGLVPVIIETNGTLLTNDVDGKYSNNGVLLRRYTEQFKDLNISVSPKNISSFMFLNWFTGKLEDEFPKHFTLKVVVSGKKNLPPPEWYDLIREVSRFGVSIVLMPEGTDTQSIKNELDSIQSLAEDLGVPYKLSPRVHILLGVR